MDPRPADLAALLSARAEERAARWSAAREQVVAATRAECGALASEGAFAAAWLVGSAAWGGWGERSDVDVVVRGLDARDFVRVWDRLGDAAGVAVDLLRWEELGEGFRARVEREGERLA